jgi:TRAP-type uncharacterized transport system substrate-binding protein
MNGTSKLASSLVTLGIAAVCGLGLSPSASAQDAGTLEVGKTGFDAKRPVLASACEHGCPWGELGDFLTAAMQPLGYDVIQCRNCNKDQGPPIVSKAKHPPALTAADIFVGTTTRVDAPVDFGITEAGFLAWAYHGLYDYAAKGPYATGSAGPFSNLRLIAKIEDETYLLVAVKTSSGITDLSQIAEQHMAVTILGGGTPISQPVLDHYGLTQSAVTSWGGSYQNAIVAGQIDNPAFDVIVSEIASPANNPESEIWPKVSQLNALTFLDIPSAVLDQLANDPTLGLTRVTAKWGLLRGIDRPIATVGRSGHAVFCRDDTPDQAAYDVAKAIDQERAELRWYIRPYSYDSRTVWRDLDVPLHPGAQRYYQEVGYMTAPPSPAGGCAVGGSNAADCAVCALVAGLGSLFARKRRRFGLRAPPP